MDLSTLSLKAQQLTALLHTVFEGMQYIDAQELETLIGLAYDLSTPIVAATENLLQEEGEML